MSVPYFPPSTTFIPIEEASKRVPTFAYQEYFANPESTAQLDRGVRFLTRCVDDSLTSFGS